jgi:hypothetical protein
METTLTQGIVLNSFVSQKTAYKERMKLAGASPAVSWAPGDLAWF